MVSGSRYACGLFTEGLALGVLAPARCGAQVGRVYPRGSLLWKDLSPTSWVEGSSPNVESSPDQNLPRSFCGAQLCLRCSSPLWKARGTVLDVCRDSSLHASPAPSKYVPRKTHLRVSFSYCFEMGLTILPRLVPLNSWARVIFLHQLAEQLGLQVCETMSTPKFSDDTVYQTFVEN